MKGKQEVEGTTFDVEFTWRTSLICLNNESFVKLTSIIEYSNRSR